MKHNFGAGPSILPKEVFEEASRAVINFNDTGLSILEISHRSKEFEEIVQETETLIRELLSVPQNHAVIFLQGGASTQFAMIPLNLMPKDGKAAYLDTGVWATKAINEAKKIGEVNVVASSADKNYSYIPKHYDVPLDSAYFHYTPNNTIFGTEIFEAPDVEIPVVADMSSDIFSREIKVSDFGLIYAGAQKNLGPAGMTLVIVDKDLLGKTGRSIPTIFDYLPHIANGSMYNTPAVFSIYVSLLNLRWLKRQGGIKHIEQENIRKAQLLYSEIDNNPLFRSTVAREDRSRMNVTFTMENPKIEAKFLNFTKERNMIGIKGHRSVGGFRISIYNALSIGSVSALISAMQEFSELNG